MNERESGLRKDDDDDRDDCSRGKAKVLSGDLSNKLPVVGAGTFVAIVGVEGRTRSVAFFHLGTPGGRAFFRPHSSPLPLPSLPLLPPSRLPRSFRR